MLVLCSWFMRLCFVRPILWWWLMEVLVRTVVDSVSFYIWL